MKTKILITEHDSNDIELIQDELKKGNVNFITESVETKEEYTNALNSFKPDIILCNYTFPDFDGLSALKIRDKLVPQTPFIFVSESIDEENTRGLFQIGFTDFVLKNRLDALVETLNRALREAELNKIKTLLKQSEEKRTEELSLIESKYHSLIQSSMDAILVTVKDGQILSANAAACKIFKMTEEELCGSTRIDIVDITDPRLQPLLKERHLTGRAKGEITFKRKDGSKFPGEITSVAFKDSFGLERTSMTIRDITERKQSEDIQTETSNALQQALNDLNSILNSSVDVICSFDKEGRFVSVSDAAETIWGYKPEELKGLKFMDLVFHEDVKRTIDEDIKIRSGMPVTIFENRYIHKNGSIVPMLWSSRWDERDQLSYAVAKDATEKKNLEKAFDIERQRFLDLYSQAPTIMVILKGPNYIFDMANLPYLKLIGRKDIIGKTVKEVLPELEDQGIFNFLDTVYETGETFSANEMLVKTDFHGNGKLVDTYLNFIYQAHRNSNGIIDGIFFFAVDVTEQVLSRKKIEESEKRFRSLIEKSEEMIMLTTVEGKLLYGSPSISKIFGYSEEDVAHKFTFEHIHPDDLPEFLIKRKEILTTPGKSFYHQQRVSHKNGNWIWCESTVTNMLHEHGINALVTNFRDITEKKITERQRQFDRNNLHALINNTDDLMWSVDIDYSLITSNKPFDDMAKSTSGKIIPKGSNILTGITPKQISIFKNFYERAFNGETFTETVYSKIPFEMWSEISYYPIRKGNEIIGTACYSRNITERKKAKLNLEKQNKELAFHNEEKENRAAELVIANKELAFQNDEKENRAAELVIANKELAFQNGEKENRAAELVIANKELAFQNDEKESRAAELVIANKELAFQNEEKENRATELIIANKELAFQNDEKESRAAELVIANKELAFQNEEKENRATELIVTNNELIKINSELDRFVYSVSHDLRSPLTSVLGLLSFIEKETNEADTLEHSKMIRNSINRLDEFIKNILSYSRNNRTGMEVKKISLQKIATAIVDSLHSLKQAKGIHFEIDIQELQPFYSDSLRINNILENLISNAIKYHKKNQTNSYIKITGQSDHEKLKFTIADNGIGISPAHHTKIFDMFFRLSGKTQGSGIGLYIVKETVEKLEGSIEVESELGTGTTFIITLKNLKPW